MRIVRLKDLEPPHVCASRHDKEKPHTASSWQVHTDGRVVVVSIVPFLIYVPYILAMIAAGGPIDFICIVAFSHTLVCRCRHPRLIYIYVLLCLIVLVLHFIFMYMLNHVYGVRGSPL